MGDFSLFHFSPICGIVEVPVEVSHCRLGRTWLEGHSEWRHISPDFSRPRGMSPGYRWTDLNMIRGLWKILERPQLWGKKKTSLDCLLVTRCYKFGWKQTRFAACPHFRRLTLTFLLEEESSSSISIFSLASSCWIYLHPPYFHTKHISRSPKLPRFPTFLRMFRGFSPCFRPDPGGPSPSLNRPHGLGGPTPGKKKKKHGPWTPELCEIGITSYKSIT